MKRNLTEFPTVTAILRGYRYEEVRTVVETLIESAVGAVEIALSARGDKETVAKIADRYGAHLMVGAGTVMNREDLEDVVAGGADFILSPAMLPRALLTFCADHQVLSVPGAFTPTEIYRSFADGADIVKVFPAARLGSRYFKDVLAPLGPMPLMAVGGIGADNAGEYLRAGASFLGVASGLFERSDIMRQNSAGLKRSLQDFTRKLKEIS